MKWMKWMMIVLCVVILSCQNSLTVKDVEPKLHEYFSNDLKSTDPTSTLYSLHILKFNPVTAKDRLMMRVNQLSDSVRYYVQMTKIENENSSANLRMMKRTRNADTTLYTKYQHDFDSAVNNARRNGERGKELIFTQNSLLRSSQKADTVKPVDYLAVCAVQSKSKDGSIKQDTVNVFVNPKMDIISKADYYARLHEK